MPAGLAGLKGGSADVTFLVKVIGNLPASFIRFEFEAGHLIDAALVFSGRRLRELLSQGQAVCYSSVEDHYDHVRHLLDEVYKGEGGRR